MTPAEQHRIYIQRIQDLPTLPTTLTRIIEVIDDPNSTAATLAAVLSKDPSISSLILKIVNSAFYGQFRQITSISHATIILGFQMVKTIAMGVTIFEATPKGSGPRFDRKKFWVHSMACAALCKRLAIDSKSPQIEDADLAFLSGLLHDVGKVIFDNFFEDEFQKVLTRVKSEKCWIRIAEEDVFGFDHTMAGYFLANKWQFPESVVSAIRFHHDLEACSEEHRPIAALVQLADHGVRSLKLGSGGDMTVPELHPDAFSLVGIDEASFHAQLDQLETEREGFEAFVS